MSVALLVVASRRFRAPTVAPVAVASVVVSGPASVAVGATAQYAATVKDADGNVLTGRTVTWRSGVEQIASVDGSGLVTGLSEGTFALIADCEGVEGSLDVGVTAGADVTAPPAIAGLVAGDPINLTIPLSWPLQPNTDGDIAGFRAYFTDNGDDPTLASAFVTLSTDPAATGATFTAAKANTLYKIALAVVDDATPPNVSALSNVVSATTGDLPATNEPAGMTTINSWQADTPWIDGEAPDASGNSTYLHYTAPWLDDTRSFIEADPTAPFGSRFVLTYHAGDKAGFSKGSCYRNRWTPEVTAMREVYVRYRFQYLPGWGDGLNQGTKFGYLGLHADGSYGGSANDFFFAGGFIPGHPNPPFGFNFVNQNDSLPIAQAWETGRNIGGGYVGPARPYQPITVGEWHTAELWLKPESALRAGDGEFKEWVDGELTFVVTGWNFINPDSGTASAPRYTTTKLNGWQIDPTIAASPTVDVQIAFGEFYISGKA